VCLARILSFYNLALLLIYSVAFTACWKTLSHNLPQTEEEGEDTRPEQETSKPRVKPKKHYPEYEVLCICL